MAELEGFICPLCMKSLPGVVQLEEHFREEHNDTATGRMKSNFKQFIGKAKTTLTKQKLEDPISEGAAAVAVRRSVAEEEDNSIKNISGINTTLWPEQEFGINRNHQEMFRKVRDSRVQRIAVETNRLLVRLEKLLKLLKNEHKMKQKQLKALEQDIVPWKKDSESKRCMNCNREFNIHRRKHHCRLCGNVICKKCSNFFPFSEAYQLMSDSPNYKSILPDPTSRQKKRKFRIISKDDDDDNEDEDDTSEELRICSPCEELLVRHLVKMESRSKTQLIALYERMQLNKDEADKLKPTYLEMADSLLSGEYHFRLIDAHEVRQNLVTLYEIVDGTSKAIMNLKYGDGKAPSVACQKIQRNVRIFASSYLQENLLTLPGLPNTAKLKEIRMEKEREAEEKRLKLMKEKEEKRELEIVAAAAAIKKENTSFGATLRKDNPSSSSSSSFSTKLEVSFSSLDSKIRLSPNFTQKAKAVLRIKKPMEGGGAKSEAGWTAESALSESQDEGLDPFELQRQQLLGYIVQAEQAKRFDEVATLKESLQEIEILMAQDGNF